MDILGIMALWEEFMLVLREKFWLGMADGVYIVCIQGLEEVVRNGFEFSIAAYGKAFIHTTCHLLFTLSLNLSYILPS